MSRVGVLLFWALACGYSLGLPVHGAEAHQLRILTSFLPVYCFTAQVAGELAEVENLLPANVEPHDFQFSRKDLQKLTHADLIIINGLGLEHWLDNALHNAAPRGSRTVVQISAGLESQFIYRPRQDTLDSSHESGIGTLPNPHIWLDPRLASQVVTNILRAVQKADPANANGYAANTARYLAQLHQLDQSLEQTLAPLRGASIVTFHDAFPYFARRYGINVAGVIEPVPDVEPSLKYLASLYRAIRANRVQAIFTEPTNPSSLARQMGSDLHLPVGPLDPLESGPLNSNAYEQTMRSNARLLLEFLKPNANRSSL